MHSSILPVYVTSLLLALCRADCVINTRSEDNLWEQKLREDLTRNYDLSEPPVYNQTIPVKTFFVIESYDVIDDEDLFRMTGMLVVDWNDGRFCWNSSQYGGLPSTMLHSITLWQPRLRQFYTVDARDEDIPFYAPCIVNSTGNVRCKLKMVFNAQCPVDLRNWPLDVQRCKLAFGTWKNEKAEARFKFSKYLYYMEVSIDTHWRVTDMTRAEYNGTELQTVLTYELAREAGTLAALLLYPAPALLLLSLACYLVPLASWLRLYLCGFSLACHYSCLAQLLIYMPRHGNNPPNLLFFYRGSFILTVLLFLNNFLLKRIATRVGMIPQWISSVNDFVMSSRWRVLVWPLWETSLRGTCAQQWTLFANIINSVSMVLVIIVYASLVVAFIPR